MACLGAVLKPWNPGHTIRGNFLSLLAARINPNYDVQFSWRARQKYLEPRYTIVYLD